MNPALTPAENSALAPAEVLNRMEVDGRPGVFLVGRNARRLTFLSQQHRALNLVWALNRVERLRGPDGGRPASTVAVVGGGLAGLTAAVAAKLLRARVTLFERKSDPVHLQRGCHFRYVHPNIYDWPAPHSDRAMTDLPCLNWGADTAHNIAESILAQWEVLKGGIEILHRHDVTRIGFPPVDGEEASRPVVRAQGPGGEHYRAYDLVILAIGFGIELTMPPLPFLSYWENDNFSRPVIAGPLPRRVLVSGCGDGGLIDAARLSIRAYDHARFVLGMIRMPGLEPLKDRLMAIDREAFDLANYDRGTPGLVACRPEQRCRIEHRVERLTALEGVDPAAAAARAVNDFHSEWLYHKYAELEVPAGLFKLLPPRDDTAVTLNGPNRSPFDLNASVLNRFVTLLLLRQGALRYRPGRVSVEPGAGPPWRVEFRDPWGPTEGAAPDTSAGSFDEVVVRHGFVRAVERLFPADLVRALTEARDPIDDPTREPQYGPDFLRDVPEAPLLATLRRKAHRDFALANIPRAAEVLFSEQVRGLGVVSDPDGGTRYEVAVGVPIGAPTDGERAAAFPGVEVVHVSPPAPAPAVPALPGPVPGSGRGRVRPLTCGVLLANLGPGAGPEPLAMLGLGTLGAFVRLADGRTALLTATPAVGGQRYAALGDRLAQPGPFPEDVVADLTAALWPVPSPVGSGLALANARPNRVDGVIAALRDGVACTQTFPPDSGAPCPPSGVGDAALDDVVFKVSAGTGLTAGRVVAVDAKFSVDSLDVFWYEGCVLVAHDETARPFADTLDCGSLVVRRRDGAAVGLVLAGNASLTLVCPLRPVLTGLGCSLL